MISTVLWLLFDFLSLKNDVKVPSKSTMQKNFLKVFSFLLASWRSMMKIEGSGSASGSASGSGSISQRHGSADPDPHQNVMDPEHCDQCCGSKDVYPGSEFLPSRIPDSASKNLSILTKKIVSKLLKIWSGLFIPDPDPNFLPIPVPRSRIQGSERHRIPDPDPQHCWWLCIFPQVSWMVEVRAVHYLLAVAAPGSAWTTGGRSQLPRGATVEVKIKNLVL